MAYKLMAEYDRIFGAVTAREFPLQGNGVFAFKVKASDPKLCPECKKQGGLCHMCGEYFPHGKLRPYKGEHKYCPKCLGEVDYRWCTDHTGCINKYHASHEIELVPITPPDCRAGGQHLDASLFRGFGFELEVERKEDGTLLCDAIDALRRIDRERYFTIERDGSLNLGFEMITRPFTLEAWPLVFGRATQVMDYLREHGYYSGTKNSNTGLHFHASKTMLDEEAQAKLLVFASHFSNSLLEVSRRTPASFKQWARCQEVNDFPHAQCTPRERLDAVVSAHVKRSCNSQRYVSINIKNSDTVEFRFFKGTLVPEYLAAAFEFVNFMVKLAQEATPDAVYGMTNSSFKHRAKLYSNALGAYIEAAEKKKLIAA